MSGPAISVWRFKDAPKEYQALSENGGDEDWVIAIPDIYTAAHGGIPWWAQDGGPLGPHCVDKFRDPMGKRFTILICCHA